MPKTRQPLNQTQAENHLRCIAQDPQQAESRKAAQKIIWQMQEMARQLTLEGILLSACRTSSENATLTEALIELESSFTAIQQRDRQVEEMLSLAREAEAKRLQPFDAACSVREGAIAEELAQAERDFRSFEFRQDAEQRRWGDLVERGVSRADAAKITGHDGPMLRSAEDLIAERNRWAAEYDGAVSALQTERAQILKFKVSRNELTLPQSVLTLVSEVAR